MELWSYESAFHEQLNGHVALLHESTVNVDMLILMAWKILRLLGMVFEKMIDTLHNDFS